jgi:hypothetical protein
MLLFSLVFFVFVTVLAAAGMFLPVLEENPATVLDEIRLMAIQASLSSTDFEGKVFLPKDTVLEIHPSPDNIVILRKGIAASRRYLPDIESYDEIDPQGSLIVIARQDGLISIRRSP